MKRLRILSIGVALGLLSSLLIATPALATVSNYAIISVVETAPGEVTVQIQGEYCTGCNANSAGHIGCEPPFQEYTGSGGYLSCTHGQPAGTYIAARVKDSGGSVLQTQKIVLIQGVNMNRDSIDTWNFVFTGLPVSAGDTLTVEADLYCSFCRHWYPVPQQVIVSASNSQVTYTGDTSGLAGTNASVSTTLIDSDTGNPLVGETITFTLDALTPVTAVTDISGVAATTYLILASMTAGTYPMEARFAGNATYFPHADIVDFEVITNRPPVADAGDDQIVEQDSYDGAVVTLDGTGSSDPDEDPLTFLWSAADITFDDPTSPTPTATFPLETTTVTLMVNDGTVDSAPDTVDITVQDTTPPEVSCIESVNPHGNNVPGGKAKGKGTGNNPDGFYELVATDICDQAPVIWVGTDCNTMLFGPYASGTVIKFTEAPGAAPSVKKIGSANGQAGAVAYHITLPSEPVIKAVDAAGLESICVKCLVPPPPK